MNIRHKGIEFGVTSDAPFIGARICAIKCSRNCPECHNQHLQDVEMQSEDVHIIIDRIKKSSIDQGIILGGLEWTEQPLELNALVRKAVEAGLQVMIYTGDTEQHFHCLFGHLETLPIYVKYGSYVADKVSYYDEEHDVTLAGQNQYIKYYG